MIDARTLALLLTLSGTTVGEPASQPASRPVELKIKRGEQIVALGDSITAAGGYLRVIDAVFAQQYPDLKIPKVINAGISGEKAEDMVKRFERDVIAKKPQIATISVGINDVWHRIEQPHDPKVLEQYKKNVDKMVQMAKDAGIRVIILSPTVIQETPDSEGNKRLKMYIQAGQEVARKREVDYVNLNEMFLKVIEKRRQMEKETSKPGEPLTTDGVHMRPMGDTLMAVGVLRALGVPDEKISETDMSKVFGQK